MRGSDDDPGMMILCIRDIFDYIETHPNLKFTLKVSYMEVYNEEINDLLGDGPVSSLSLSLSLSLFVSDSLSLSLSLCLCLAHPLGIGVKESSDRHR
jgi:hypothetical protein